MFLIVGADSRIGGAVLSACHAEEVPAVGTTRGVAGPGRVRLDLDALPPDWRPPAAVRAACVAAAVTRLADCEADPVAAERVNVAGTVELVRRLAACGVHALFLSSNQVFDGRMPHMPADAPRTPVSVYGRQKARAEWALERMMAQGAPVGILRLSKVVWPDMKLLADWRRRLGAGAPVQAFADMALAPVPLAAAARAIVALLGARDRGVAQLSGPRDLSYAEAGRIVADLLGADPALVAPGSSPVSLRRAGATPTHTTLDSRLLAERHGIAVADARVVLAETLACR